MSSIRVPISVAVAVLAMVGVAGCGSSSQDDGGNSGPSSAAAKAGAKDLGIDLANCDSDFSKQISGDIKVGQSIPRSGSYAALGALADGVKAAVGAQNKKGGIEGHKIKLFQTDDQYLPAKTSSATQEFIDKDQVDAVVGTLGTSNALAVTKLVTESCLPYLEAYTGASTVLNAPDSYPWITGGVLSYNTEPRAWVDKINEEFPDGTKIAMFSVNNDAGKEYQAALKAALKDSKSTLERIETYEQGETASPSSQITTLKSTGAKVLVAHASGAMCSTVLKELANQGWEPLKFSVNGCAPYLSLGGKAADGVIVGDWLKNPVDPAQAEDQGVKDYKNDMAAYAAKAKIDTFAPAGYVAGQTFIEIAKKAAASPLGLSRLGLLVAAHRIDFEPTMTLPGVKMSMNGKSDTVPVETVVLGQFVAASGNFKSIKTYGYEGQMTTN